VPTHVRQKIAIPMQAFTARVSQTSMEVMGVDVKRDGNSLTVNGQSVMIIEACNGMRMVFPLMLVGYAFSFGMPLRQWVRLLILILSPVAAVVCNVVRILITILLLAFGPPKVGEVFHDVAGWGMVAFAFLLLLGVVRLLRWAMIPVTRYTLVAQ